MQCLMAKFPSSLTMKSRDLMSRREQRGLPLGKLGFHSLLPLAGFVLSLWGPLQVHVHECGRRSSAVVFVFVFVFPQ